jgi:ribonuclease HI
MYYYVVNRGHRPGIYNTWDECLNYIKGYPNAIYKKLNNREDAEYFLKYGEMPALDREYIKKENEVAIFTDGSTIRQDNNIKYGYGVYIPVYNIEVSEQLIDKNPTNNRCELTAILVGINIMVNEHNDIKNLHIYTDSQYSITMLNKNEYTETTVNRDLLEKIQLLIYVNGLIVKYHKVEAHTGYKDNISIANSIVDKLAYNGANISVNKDRLTFGKYKGFLIKNVPREYLGWLVKQRRQSWVNRSIENDINNVIEYFKSCLNRE